MPSSDSKAKRPIKTSTELPHAAVIAVRNAAAPSSLNSLNSTSSLARFLWTSPCVSDAFRCPRRTAPHKMFSSPPIISPVIASHNVSTHGQRCTPLTVHAMSNWGQVDDSTPRGDRHARLLPLLSSSSHSLQKRQRREGRTAACTHQPVLQPAMSQSRMPVCRPVQYRTESRPSLREGVGTPSARTCHNLASPPAPP